MESAHKRLMEALSDETDGPSRTLSTVPTGYAERAMNSLMVLHNDLMAEKERVLDLTRRVMEERQGRAELEAYVRLLEADIAGRGGPRLGELRAGGSDLRRAEEALRAAPVAPAAADEPPAADPAPAAVSSEEGHRVPRPPRPSRRYRSKLPTHVNREEAPVEPPAPQGRRRPDDGWRQW